MPHRGPLARRASFRVICLVGLVQLLATLPFLRAAARRPGAEMPPDALVASGEETAPNEPAGPIVENENTISLVRLKNAPPSQAVAEFDKAWRAFEDGDMERAIRKLRKTVENYPNFTEAHNNLGYLYWRTGDLDNGRKEFEEAVALDPTWNTAVINLALAYYADGNPDKALATAMKALRLDPRCARAHYAAGLLLLKTNTDRAAALDHLRRASRVFPKAQLMAVYVMLQLDRPDQAQQTLLRYLDGLPAR